MPMSEDPAPARTRPYALPYRLLVKENIVLDSPGTRSHPRSSADNGVWISYP
jgi:hypothetical protein